MHFPALATSDDEGNLETLSVLTATTNNINKNHTTPLVCRAGLVHHHLQGNMKRHPVINN